MINLVTPVVRGQRGLIVSPPKAGKTTILKQMARELSVPGAHHLKKEDLILKIQQTEAEREGIELRGGVLEL